MNNLFPPELRTASVVHRWSIVRTLKPDNVAEHSYYVACYAVAIARLIEWQGPLGDLTFFALMHDAEELVTGDLVSPVKNQIVDESLFERFVTDQMSERLPLIQHQMTPIAESPAGLQIEKIVKVADKVDAVLFLITEIKLGNSSLGMLLKDAYENLKKAWLDLCVEIQVHPAGADELWLEVRQAIESHHKFGGIGIT